MDSSILIGKGKSELYLLPRMANRHGLIAGATGTGKTVTLKVLAEGLSRLGVPVFMADVKGDLAGLSRAGAADPKLTDRCAKNGMAVPQFTASPVTFWDVFGEQGHPVRATVSDLGPLLLSRLLNLNDTQAAVLELVFKIADDSGMLLLDIKDLQAMLQHVGEHAKEYQTSYGNISAASIGAIQRGVLSLDQQGGERFFGEPALNIDDLLQTDERGMGYVNILAADKLMQIPKVYSTFLLWLLSDLFEKLPEVGDPEKPKLVFFFDEAHLLFNDAPKALLEKIEQVVRLIRSKGVGVFFVSQNPLDIPETVAAQLGNRVEHALRAFTAKDQKAVRAAAQTFRSDGSFDVAKAIMELAVGEALVSMLDENGAPGVVQRAMIAPPASRFGPIAADERQSVIKRSLVYGQYENAQDRQSAYEMLKNKAQAAPKATPVQTDSAPSAPSAGGGSSGWGSIFSGIFGGGRGRRQSPAEAMVNSAARSVGNQIARQLVRGLLGSLSGSQRGR